MRVLSALLAAGYSDAYNPGVVKPIKHFAMPCRDPNNPGVANLILKFKRGEFMSLQVGDMAPDFELKSHAGGTVKLSDFRGKKNVFIAFYPLDWTPV